MRRAVLAVAGALLLSGPAALAFFSGGYYAEPRLIAAIVVWALVLALILTGDSPLPRALPGQLALGGLGLLTLWSSLSVTWAPLGGPAIEAVERLVLYTGALLLAVGVLPRRACAGLGCPSHAGGAPRRRARAGGRGDGRDRLRARRPAASWHRGPGPL